MHYCYNNYGQDSGKNEQKINLTDQVHLQHRSTILKAVQLRMLLPGSFK